jgi:hypothetical protein
LLPPKSITSADSGRSSASACTSNRRLRLRFGARLPPLLARGALWSGSIAPRDQQPQQSAKPAQERIRTASGH